MRSSVKKPISLVLFDAFDTLVTPRKAPYLQYADEARKVGLVVENERMRDAFKQSFKEMTVQHPVYGLYSGLQSTNEWWTLLIEKTLLNSGVSVQDLQGCVQPLVASLLRRFASKDAYETVQGVHQTIGSIQSRAKEQNRSPFAMSLATNSDHRIIYACRDLGLGDFLNLEMHYSSTNQEKNPAPSLSYDIGYEKPSVRFFHSAVQRSFPPFGSKPYTLEEMCSETLYVGDHFTEDYLGASEAGLQAVWLKKSQNLPEGREDVPALRSFHDLTDFIALSWT